MAVGVEAGDLGAVGVKAGGRYFFSVLLDIYEMYQLGKLLFSSVELVKLIPGP